MECITTEMSTPRGINTLVLDEPTNHLDVESREVLESVPEDFDGTLIVVSHGRYMLNRRVTLIDWLQNGHLERGVGTFDEVRLSQAVRGGDGGMTSGIFAKGPSVMARRPCGPRPKFLDTATYWAK